MKRLLTLLRWIWENSGNARGFQPCDPVPPPGISPPPNQENFGQYCEAAYWGLRLGVAFTPEEVRELQALQRKRPLTATEAREAMFGRRP